MMGVRLLVAFEGGRQIFLQTFCARGKSVGIGVVLFEPFLGVKCW